MNACSNIPDLLEISQEEINNSKTAATTLDNIDLGKIYKTLVNTQENSEFDLAKDLVFLGQVNPIELKLAKQSIESIEKISFQIEKNIAKQENLSGLEDENILVEKISKKFEEVSKEFNSLIESN